MTELLMVAAIGWVVAVSQAVLMLRLSALLRVERALNALLEEDLAQARRLGRGRIVDVPFGGSAR